jgi:hypothetical protein
MSDQIPGGKADGASGEVEKKDSVSYDTFSKVLTEKKKVQQDFNEMKARVDASEQEKLEAQGKLKEALEFSKKQTDEWRNKSTNLVKNVTNKVTRSQFMTVAEKLGCVDPDLAMSACNFDDIDVDVDTLELDKEKLTQKLQELTKTKPYLFKKDARVPADINPSNSRLPEKNLSELSEDQLKQLLQNAK